MRTAFELNDEILRRAKERAAQEGLSLKAVVEDALHLCLNTPPASKFRLKWNEPIKGAIQPGVHLK